MKIGKSDNVGDSGRTDRRVVDRSLYVVFIGDRRGEKGRERMKERGKGKIVNRLAGGRIDKRLEKIERKESKRKVERGRKGDRNSEPMYRGK